MKKTLARLLLRNLVILVPRRSSHAAAPPRRILVWTMRGIGNTIMAVPLIRELKKHYPSAEIDAVAAASMEPILSAEGVAKTFDEGPAWIDWWNLFRKIRCERYDAALVAYPSASFRKAFALWLAAIPKRIAAADSRCPTDRDFYFFYSDVVPHRPGVHDIDANLALIAPLGLKVPERAEFAKREPPRRDVPLIGVHPGTAAATASHAKRWPLERFAETMRRLHEETSAQFVVFEGPDERGAGRQLCDMVGSAARIVEGASGLAASMDVMQSVDLFVSNDSGLAHLASWMGLPTVVVYGPTDPAVVGTRGRVSISIESAVECHPCWDRYAPQPVNCPYAFKCMPEISADTVVSAVLRALPQFGSSVS